MIIIKLHTLGIDFHHNSEFVIDRPSGSGDSLILIFKTPAALQLNNVVLQAPAGSAVIFSPEFHQHYGACGDEYINHWVHFDCEGDNAFLQRIGLRLNTLLTPPDITSAERVLELLSIESVSAAYNAQESIDLLLRLLLTKLADGSEKGESSLYRSALRELRAAIYRAPSEPHSIDAIASSLSLSASHFQHLYKREFGVSCYEDVIAARHEMAKYYLRTTVLPIKKIAELCGFDNDVHFMRQFKKRNGLTATEYRKLPQNA